MNKAYSHTLIEKKWLSIWKKENLFARNKKKKKYSLLMPPPNVTGQLHIGHALVNILQDILSRWKKMCGYEVLWIAGLDHAGIATQSAVEQHLYKTTGEKKSDIPKEKFLEKIWAWKEEKEARILKQLEKLGLSIDLSHHLFTMDKRSTVATEKTFKELYEKGLIYRGKYLVNLDPILETAISDEEVEHKQKEGFLYYLKYPFEKSYLIVATTRPETIFGDVALAVPKDPKTKHLVGKMATVPLCNRKIPIICDDYVDPSFGSGILKITPAHDFNDYELGKKHNLPSINLLNKNGTVNKFCQEFENSTVEECRKKVLEKLKSLDLIEKVESYQQTVAISQRSKGVIEPYLSEQWFVKMGPFKKKLESAVKRFQIIPKHWESTYLHWIENLKDWCISRQIIWGHRIPIYYTKEGKTICLTEEEPKEGLKRDPDVLDTWFSSALAPLVVMEWPDKQNLLEEFYPIDSLITGYDILFFWVARMIMMGDYFTDKIPFKKALVHGLVFGRSYWREKNGIIDYLDKKESQKYEMGAKLPKEIYCKWEKMSKSKNNTLDPLEIIEIYGTDATRFALSSLVGKQKQIDIEISNFVDAKNFVNKIWNAVRFVVLSIPTDIKNLSIDPDQMDLSDKWILSRESTITRLTNERFENLEISEGVKSLRSFFFDSICSTYLEITKPFLREKQESPISINKQKILLKIVINFVKLIHPVLPFVTEEIFQIISNRFPSTIPDPKFCILSNYPQKEFEESEEYNKNFSKIEELVYSVRNLLGELGIKESITLYVYGKDIEFVKENKTIVEALLKKTKILFSLPPDGLSANYLISNVKISIPISTNLHKELKTKTAKEIEKKSTEIRSLEKSLSNKNFTTRAPEELVKKTYETLESKKKELLTLKKLLSSISLNVRSS